MKCFLQADSHPGLLTLTETLQHLFILSLTFDWLNLIARRLPFITFFETKGVLELYTVKSIGEKIKICIRTLSNQG